MGDKAACTKREITITEADLPLCCPMPTDTLWNAHPRVYLPVKAQGRYVCPYCSTEYVLSDKVAR